MLRFTSEKIVDGVVERMFAVEVEGESVPGVLWVAEGTRRPRPLVLMGHGGSQHKKTPGIRARGNGYAKELGYAVAAIDAPGHGDRISREAAMAYSREVGSRIREGRPLDSDALKAMAERTRQAVPEWRTTLDALQELDEIGAGAVGYWGVSMGTAIGVPFVASEPRIRCAIFGLAGLRPGASDFEQAARRISVPVQFAFQWDDEVAPRDHGIALFEAFASEEKSMHINPGGHLGIPRHEVASWQVFYQRHLGNGSWSA
jgi:dienelactone hydrolase